MKHIYYLYEIGIDIPRYIGMTKTSLKQRFKSHKCAKGNTKRERWIREALAGGGLGIQLIETAKDDVALEREEYWTRFYQNVVNLRIGHKASEELSQIFSRAQKNKVINWEALRKTHEKCKGQKRTKAFCENLSKKLKGVPKKRSSVEKMKQHHTEKYGWKISIDGVSYPSINEAARLTGIERSTIRMVLIGRIPNYSKHKIIRE